MFLGYILFLLETSSRILSELLKPSTTSNNHRNCLLKHRRKLVFSLKKHVERHFLTFKVDNTHIGTHITAIELLQKSHISSESVILENM